VDGFMAVTLREVTHRYPGGPTALDAVRPEVAARRDRVVRPRDGGIGSPETAAPALDVLDRLGGPRP
jgi:hypothetical protein